MKPATLNQVDVDILRNMEATAKSIEEAQKTLGATVLEQEQANEKLEATAREQ